ncbi:MAG: NAD-dependent malic enzyme [Myxococcota bacterium]
MRRMNIDTVFRLRLAYRPGQLAKVATVVAEEGGLLGEISSVRLGDDHTIRDVTVETEDEEQTRKIEGRIRQLEGVEILSVVDAVFDCHVGGKLKISSIRPLSNLSELRKAYTPGVARVSMAVKQDPALAWKYTGLSNSVGIFTNGTRVLGLGDIGPVASLPVMEGKAVLYDRFIGISAFPVLINTKDPDEFIETVIRVSPSFGGIHLEDIRSPDCFRIEAELIRRLQKPVMHDDQHGTAVVALAAVINACKIANLPLSEARVAQIGLGAAGAAIARLVMAYGVRQMMVADRSDEAVSWMESLGAQRATLDEIMRKADIVLSATGRPGLISPSMIRRGQVIFALSNPNPEIDSQVAVAAGAAFASDGKSINNALAFPGIFRGALACRASSISNEMKIAAAKAIAELADDGEVVPDPLNPAVHQAVATAVETTARAQNLADRAVLC